MQDETTHKDNIMTYSYILCAYIHVMIQTAQILLLIHSGRLVINAHLLYVCVETIMLVLYFW